LNNVTWLRVLVGILSVYTIYNTAGSNKQLKTVDKGRALCVCVPCEALN